MIIQWEYQSTRLLFGNMLDALNDRGEQGWEVCMATPIEDGREWRVYFKRPKRNRTDGTLMGVI